MDDIDEWIAFRQLAEPLIVRLGLEGDARDAVVAELWREREMLTPLLLLADDADEERARTAGRAPGH